MLTTQLAESQTRDSKKILHLKHLIQSDPHLLHTNLLDQTKTLLALRCKEPSSLQGRVQRVLQTVDDLAPVGDAFAQGQIAPVTITWGSVRLMVRVSLLYLCTTAEVC